MQSGKTAVSTSAGVLSSESRMTSFQIVHKHVLGRTARLVEDGHLPVAGRSEDLRASVVAMFCCVSRKRFAISRFNSSHEKREEGVVTPASLLGVRVRQAAAVAEVEGAAALALGTGARKFEALASNRLNIDDARSVKLSQFGLTAQCFQEDSFHFKILRGSRLVAQKLLTALNVAVLLETGVPFERLAGITLHAKDMSHFDATQRAFVLGSVLLRERLLEECHAFLVVRRVPWDDVEVARFEQLVALPLRVHNRVEVVRQLEAAKHAAVGKQFSNCEEQLRSQCQDGVCEETVQRWSGVEVCIHEPLIQPVQTVYDQKRHVHRQWRHKKWWCKSLVWRHHSFETGICFYPQKAQNCLAEVLSLKTCSGSVCFMCLLLLIHSVTVHVGY